jgi:hypothetical protein
MNDIDEKIKGFKKLVGDNPAFDFSKSGCRIEFVSMDDPYHSLEKGSKGTVFYTHRTDNSRVLVVEWDNGHQISLIEGKDKFHLMSANNE